jgi:hypothetical protein
MNKYWESETPIEVNTGKNILRYFATAKKLQVSMPNWINADNEWKQGKTITIDVPALTEIPAALDILQQIIEMGGK